MSLENLKHVYGLHMQSLYLTWYPNFKFISHLNSQITFNEKRNRSHNLVAKMTIMDLYTNKVKYMSIYSYIYEALIREDNATDTEISQ